MTEPAEVTCGLDANAAEALKKFAKKNRPSGFQARFHTVMGQVTEDPSPLVDAKREDATVCELAEKPAIEIGARSVGAGALMEAEKVPRLCDPKLQNFDIFDNLDEERVRDFEQLFAESRANSNFDAFKKKNKKADPNKFVTCSGLQTAEDGSLVLS
mmetsp:Transcript_70991/g.197203  ORF Transcript_70991/g.197203 Transcript_70991/m.197203 type:complete len:157 (-) Transcript_70991:239-709(-)|eukprot:CAMPEP_0117510570 /NCGR_PEP_ID=MMETSP0784-20121206/28057_1 /TAXON_ID=39447 /ORGANISM="" /LENGTH=156 /DNA_ID=CAMNT_0005306209 /DNA_START=64 /DNA_END=534 /DNA_ORIENTATION=+